MMRSLLSRLRGSPTPADSGIGAIDTSARNLMVVLRETVGVNKTEPSLEPFGAASATLASGPVNIDLAWFAYLGDMHVRFVFDGPTHMLNATLADLARLELTPEAALELAMQNLRRAYGAPRATPWNGLLQIESDCPDLNSSYFLDRALWDELHAQHPEGLVAIVPKRGGLLYAPARDLGAVDKMRQAAGYLHESSEQLRVSSGVYLFHDGAWSVLQAPKPVADERH